MPCILLQLQDYDAAHQIKIPVLCCNNNKNLTVKKN